VRGIAWRFGLSLAVLAAFFMVWALRAADPKAYLMLPGLVDGAEHPAPFTDMRAILQAGACWRTGVDVYRPSACLGGGVFNYSPLLLRAAHLRFGPQDTVWGGLLLIMAFAAALAWLPKPASRVEFTVMLAAALSTTSFYALEQGNLDVGVFALAVAGVRAALAGRRLSGYALFAGAAAAKFYPMALFILLLRESPRRLIALGLAGGLVLILCLALYARDLAAAVAIIPSGTPFKATFGAIDMPRGLNRLHLLSATNVNHILGFHLFNNGQTVARLAAGLMSLASLALMRAAARHYARRLPGLAQDRLIFLVAGSAVILFCFFAAQNVEYRAVFLLFTLPGLLACGRASRRGQSLVAAELLLLWEAVIRALAGGTDGPATTPALVFWLCREALWWWLIIELGGIGLAFVTGQTRRWRRQAAKTAR